MSATCKERRFHLCLDIQGCCHLRKEGPVAPSPRTSLGGCWGVGRQNPPPCNLPSPPDSGTPCWAVSPQGEAACCGTGFPHFPRVLWAVQKRKAYYALPFSFLHCPGSLQAAQEERVLWTWLFPYQGNCLGMEDGLVLPASPRESLSNMGKEGSCT